MKIIAVDDERLALESLTNSIKKAAPDSEVISFRNGLDAIEYCKQNQVDIAFLDISMREILGVEVATEIKKFLPKINIIFSTGYDEYRDKAFDMHASGYITKPITYAKVKKEIDDLRYPPEKQTAATQSTTTVNYKFKIRCFGNFDVFTLDGKSVHFERQKAKELFAYLVFRQGASCTIKEIATILFEEGLYDKKEQVYIQKIISSLMKTMKAYNAEDLINRAYNSLGVNKLMLDCDYYHAIDNKDYSQYMGEFLAQYSWAEEFNYYFDS